MTTINTGAFDFARAHVDNFYDTDFYPKPFEYEVIWSYWPEVSEELSRKAVESHHPATPRMMPWQKVRSGFRFVHQLEPLDCLIYTALAYTVADEIEAARAPVEDRVACAYRIDPTYGSFFSAGSGYEMFRQASSEYAKQFSHVLLTDIADFYNSIYLHRVRGAVEHADYQFRNLAVAIEKFLLTLNGKTSQGIPVGPAASIIFSEACLTDVDQFLTNRRIRHVRYVDDFRIFANSPYELEQILEEMSLYLYDIHRLSLVGDKTKLMPTTNFEAEELNNQYQLEKVAILESVEVLNPYTHEVEIIEQVPDGSGELLADALARVSQFEHLDLGIARAIIRRARGFRLDSLIPKILDRFEFYIPVVNDVALYLNEVTDDDICARYGPVLAQMAEAGRFSRQAVRLWMEWLFSQNPAYVRFPEIRHFLNQSPSLVHQAQAAVALRDLSWVRSYKSQLSNHTSWDRRAILYAAQMLPSDERTTWLRSVTPHLTDRVDQLVAKWITERKFELPDFDLPF